jgi:hypothetical protein
MIPTASQSRFGSRRRHLFTLSLVFGLWMIMGGGATVRALNISAPADGSIICAGNVQVTAHDAWQVELQLTATIEPDPYGQDNPYQYPQESPDYPSLWMVDFTVSVGWNMIAVTDNKGGGTVFVSVRYNGGDPAVVITGSGHCGTGDDGCGVSVSMHFCCLTPGYRYHWYESLASGSASPEGVDVTADGTVNCSADAAEDAVDYYVDANSDTCLTINDSSSGPCPGVLTASCTISATVNFELDEDYGDDGMVWSGTTDRWTVETYSSSGSTTQETVTGDDVYNPDIYGVPNQIGPCSCP